MAPRRTNKGKRTRGAEGSRASQGSDEEEVFVPYKGNKFQTREAKEEFNRLMTITVSKERGFTPSWSADGELDHMIQNMGWQVICAPPDPVPLSVVREFYAHAKAQQNGFSWVRGKAIVYTPRAIRTILEQPPLPGDDERWVHKTKEEVDLDHIVATICVPGTEWKRRPISGEHITFPAYALNRFAKAWNLFICANIMPSSHTHDITVDRAIVLWGILNQKYIDVGYLVHQNILRFLRREAGGAIPHASVIARLCASVQVKVAPDEPLQSPSAVLDHTAIMKLAEWAGGIPEPHGLGYQPHPSESPFSETPVQTPIQTFGSDAFGGSGAGTSQPHLEDMGDTSGLSHVQYMQLSRRMTRRVDRTHDMTRQYTEDLTRALMQQQQGLPFSWPVFGAHSVYPPPDTPPDEGDHADI